MGMLTLQSVNAQRKEGKTRTPEQMVEKLDKKLNLTDEQEKQITTLYSDFFQAGFITRRTQKCHAGTGKENNIPAYRRAERSI